MKRENTLQIPEGPPPPPPPNLIKSEVIKTSGEFESVIGKNVGEGDGNGKWEDLKTQFKEQEKEAFAHLESLFPDKKLPPEVFVKIDGESRKVISAFNAGNFDAVTDALTSFDNLIADLKKQAEEAANIAAMQGPREETKPIDNPDAVETVAPAEGPIVTDSDIAITAAEPIVDAAPVAELAGSDSSATEETPKGRKELLRKLIGKAKGTLYSTQQRIDSGIDSATGGASERYNQSREYLASLMASAKGTLYSTQQRIDSMVEGASEKYGWMKNYLNNRVAELDSKSVEMSGMEEWFRNLGQKYNKLGFKSKIAIGISLGAGASAFAGVSVPVAIAFATGLGVQRFLGMAGAFLKFERDWSAKESGKFIAKKEKAILKATAYSLLMGYGIMKGVEVASESSYGGAVQEWLRAHWPFADTTRPSVPENTAKVEPTTNQAPASFSEMSPDEVVPPTPDNSVMPETTASVGVPPNSNEIIDATRKAINPDIPAASVAETTVTPPETVTSSIPEISVEATKGKGYEFMVKRVWEQLQGQNLDPNNYPIGSDIRRLLEADQQSIDRIVHKIAADPKHNFFHADGTSVRIDLDSKMSINASGDIELGGNVRASDDSPITPSYNAEQASAPNVADSPSGVYEVPEITVDTRVLESPDSLPDAPPTPSAERIEPYTNENNVTIDLNTAHIYSDKNGAIYSCGNNFTERLEAAKGYVLANPKASVWVQAEKPVLINGELKPCVIEVKNGGFFRGILVLDQNGAPDKSHIGYIDPENFTKRLV